MYILGINAYHAGSSACLVENGQLIAAAEEERFNRRKYWSGFPVQAIQYVLDEAHISPYDLDHVGISRNPTANLMIKGLFALSKRPSLDLIRERLANANEVRDPKTRFVKSLRLDGRALRAQFHNVEHHRAHMASAFFVSPYQDAAVLSVDGMGDFISTMWGVGQDTRIEVNGAIHFPHSLGFLYTMISQWLGFPKYGDEGKVMGLAPYGKPRYMDKFSQLILPQRDGTFELNLDYLTIHTEGITMSWEDGDPVLGNLYSRRLIDLLGEPRAPGSAITKYHEDVARTLQETLEEHEFNLVRKLERETRMKAITMAGGVALNSAFNGKVLPATKFRDIFIQPSAGDAGTAMGVCYYIYHQLLGKPRAFALKQAYTGPGFSNAMIQKTLEQYNLKYEALEEELLVRRAAEIVENGDILGWFQGRMEWGPRALGNRSIIADPRRNNIKDILNARIKHREKFRPFAPSILLKDVGDYFDQTYPDPFMIKVYNVLPEKRSSVPAITHVDGTGRLQTVDFETAPLYWKLISAFKEYADIPLVLNTSFNENEPIVCTPKDAIECFLRTKMDALALGNYLILKSSNT